MKTLFSCLLFCNAILIAQGQSRLAIIGGAQSSMVNTDESFPNRDDYDSRTGIHLGLLADIPFSSRFAFQPAAMFAHKGWKKETTTVFEQKLNYVDVPLNIVFKAPLGETTKFLIGAGPYVSALVSGKEITGTTEIDDLPKGDGVGKYKGFDYGFNALIGVEFGRVFITANYLHGLNDFYRPANYNSDYKHRVIGGTIGFFLKRSTPKIKDKDNDGIVDAEDECPEEPGPAATKGCPDRDGDGIADKDDKCPDQAGTAKYNGCPIPDTDNDGINDELDKCPTVPGLAKYNGCPIPDSDNDGINDEEDKCPTVAGIAKYNGCPIPDTDNDGINDEEDNCITLPGTKENQGCPEINPKLNERVSSLGRRIQFSSNNSATLTATGKKVLDDVVGVMNEDPNLQLSIEGHTSAGGNEETNVKVSQDRADAIKAYLESKGIADTRITTQGLGSSQPVSDGTTAAEKAKNRRVELKLSYK